jgi:hypothetical protein
MLAPAPISIARRRGSLEFADHSHDGLHAVVPRIKHNDITNPRHKMPWPTTFEQASEKEQHMSINHSLRDVATFSRRLLLLTAAFTLLPAIVWSQEYTVTNPTTLGDEGAAVEPSPKPSAYVYVSDEPNPNYYGVMEVYGFAAASNGKLTPIPGSPFKFANVSWMATNGKYLFGNEIENAAIETFSIASNGALKLAETYSASGDELVGPVELDHSGEFLYAYTSNGGTGNFRSLGIDGSNGKLHEVNQVPISFGGYDWLSFLPNDQYAYAIGNSCSDEGGFYAFSRAGNGELASITIADPMPETPEGNHNYCVDDIAPDGSGHVAALIVDTNTTSATPVLAAFTAGANGNLTTTNTHLDMPEVGVYNVQWLRMSPNGKFLAVGGEGGLELFHVNGASPITKYKTLLTQAQSFPVQMYWDNDNHLYVIGENDYAQTAVWVFTVTATGVTEAPGSPLVLGLPNDVSDYMIVLPK